MKATEHGALITAAARSILRPIGCAQKGRSRTWLDDHGWWVTVIEFQPSSWSRGSYLNVGACWLWSGKDHLSFDEGYRIQNFREFQGVDNFEQAALELAESARDEVLRLRTQFVSIASVAAYLDAKKYDDLDLWGHFHAGISAGLAGWTDKARRRLEAVVRVAEWNTAWVEALKRRCESLLLVIDDAPSFRREINEAIVRERTALKLPMRNTDINIQ